MSCEDLASDRITPSEVRSICAVLVHASVLAGAPIWLVADQGVLDEHPDITASGAGVFFFDEIEQLRGRPADELRALCATKAVFPAARILP